MLQRILMILLAFTLASAWAARADDWNVELVGKTPGAAYEVFILDNYAYLCAGSVLVILDISDPSNPTAVGQASLPDTGRGIHVSGGYAYVADESEGLRVIDITALSDPQEVGFYDTPVGFDQNLIYLPREPLREVKKMPVVKIGPKHQVTIPKEIFDELYLQPGDFLEAVAQDGKIISTWENSCFHCLCGSMFESNGRQCHSEQSQRSRLSTAFFSKLSSSPRSAPNDSRWVRMKPKWPLFLSTDYYDTKATYEQSSGSSPHKEGTAGSPPG